MFVAFHARVVLFFLPLVALVQAAAQAYEPGKQFDDAELLRFEGFTDVPECHSFDTAVEWFLEPDVARQAAQRQSKLLLVMHLSGNFGKAAFT